MRTGTCVCNCKQKTAVHAEFYPVYEVLSMNFLVKNRRRIFLYAIDMAVYTMLFILHFLTSHLESTKEEFVEQLLPGFINFLMFFVCISAARILLRCYSNVWRYANCRAYIELVLADALGGLVAYLITYFCRYAFNAYISVWKCITVCACSCLVSLTMRFAYQLLHKRSSAAKVKDSVEKKKIAILGAGMVGALLAEELVCYKGSKYQPVFFIDSDMVKTGSRVSGLPVYSDGEIAIDKISEYGVEELIVAITKLDIDKTKQIFDYYGKTGCKIKVYDFPTRDGGNEEKRVIREFRIEDLLFRDTINLVDDDTKNFYAGKTVLVTGGGGSIGSELCRQIAKCGPKKLVIFDIYENNAYDIQQELVRKYGKELDLDVEIGSVRDRARLDALFAYHRPEIVFHAAAHKHVPLMERSNCEAIKNNVFGTYNTADMAEKYGVKKFILISTDKAVNPTNVMGASKRMCEMVVQCRTDSDTVFSAVRFGNVLGSNGSVIPLFNRQIANGGPVTLTDKRIVRYFMTIPEASGLVMQAGAMAKRNELFVLDMGKPVKIYDLAVNMIRFSGLEPYREIEIKEIGLRPGEKLYEELLVKKEELNKTDNDLIFIEREAPPVRSEVEAKLEVLRAVIKANENNLVAPDVKTALKSVVPTFVEPEEINATAESADEMKNTVDTN